MRYNGTGTVLKLSINFHIGGGDKCYITNETNFAARETDGTPDVVYGGQTGNLVISRCIAAALTVDDDLCDGPGAARGVDGFADVLAGVLGRDAAELRNTTPSAGFEKYMLQYVSVSWT